MIERGNPADLQLFRRNSTPKQRRIFQVCGMGNGLDFGVHNNSLKNLRRGLVERVFYVEDASKQLSQPPSPKPQVFKGLKRYAKRVSRLAGMHSPIPREQYPGLYEGRRKTIYQNALTSLESRPISRRDSFLKTFVKAEKINFTRKPDPAPRVIQPRDPRYNLELGRYLKPFEHHLIKALDGLWGGVTVLKGYTVEELGAHIHGIWNEFEHPAATGFDMKRFDQHVSVEALQFEHSIYNKCFKSPELQKLLSWQLDNKGVGHASDGYIKYTRQGCRMSGDINTSMGNCLLACIITKGLVEGIKTRLINNGDDCVLFYEKSDGPAVRERLKNWIDYGFQCEAEPEVEVLEELEFCQMKPVCVDGEWIMVRNPLVTLSKDTYSINQWPDVKSAMAWLRAIGDCGIALTGGVPICQAYYSCLQRNCPATKSSVKGMRGSLAFDSGMARLAARCSRGQRVVGEETRASFQRAFGIPPSWQLAIETYYEGLKLNMEFDPAGIIWNKLPPPEALLLQYIK